MLEETKKVLSREPIEIVEKTHQYIYNKKEKFVSVSKILSMLEEPFEEMKMAVKCSENPKHEHYKVSPAKIIEIWRANNQLRKNIGHNAHTYNEGVLLNDTSKTIQAIQSPFFRSLYASSFTDFYLKVLQANKIQLIGCEVIMCYPKFTLGGTTDYLGLWNQNLIIADWKTNESFKDSSNYYLVKPFNFLDKSDLTKYTLQTYMYRFMLEENYGLSLPFQRIVWFGEPKSQFTYKHAKGLNWYSFAPKFAYDKSLIQDVIQFGLDKC